MADHDIDRQAESAKHTPGPWSCEDQTTAQCVFWAIYGADGNGIAYLTLQPDRVPANALLISAAPDLLEALQEAVRQYGKPGGPWNVPSDPGGWLDRARTAITKATEKRDG